MRLHIEIYGCGSETVIGYVDSETYKYVNEHYDGNVEEYLRAIDNGEVPDKYCIVDDSSEWYELDGIFHSTACDPSGNWTIVITDENGNTICELTSEDVDTELDKTEYITAPKYISLIQSFEKASYLGGDFEIDGQFDPTKLKLLYNFYNFSTSEDSDDLSYLAVTGFKYDGKTIECEFIGDGRGVGMEFSFIELA